MDETLEVETAIGTVVFSSFASLTHESLRSFERGAMGFGRRRMFFLPAHGDLGCGCQPCRMYELMETYKRRGWYPAFIEGEEDPSEVY